MQEEDTKNVDKESKGNYTAKNELIDEDNDSEKQDGLIKNYKPKEKDNAAKNEQADDNKKMSQRNKMIRQKMTIHRMSKEMITQKNKMLLEKIIRQIKMKIIILMQTMIQRK